MPPIREHPDVEHEAGGSQLQAQVFASSFAQIKGLIRLLMSCKLSTYCLLVAPGEHL